MLAPHKRLPHPRTDLMQRIQFALVVLTMVAVLVGVRIVLSPGPSERERVEGMRDRLRVLRVAVDSCATALDVGEQAVQDRVTGTDSLRARIEALESIDPRGVPQDSYQTYLSLVDRFNRAVAAWDTLGQDAEAQRQDCRMLVLQHNLLSDSVRRFFEARGLVPSVGDSGLAESIDPEDPEDSR
jgi:hypothetical protein